MSRQKTMDSLFELVDVWTKTIDPLDYRRFLKVTCAPLACPPAPNAHTTRTLPKLIPSSHRAHTELTRTTRTLPKLIPSSQRRACADAWLSRPTIYGVLPPPPHACSSHTLYGVLPPPVRGADPLQLDHRGRPTAAAVSRPGALGQHSSNAIFSLWRACMLVSPASRVRHALTPGACRTLRRSRQFALQRRPNRCVMEAIVPSTPSSA